MHYKLRRVWPSWYQVGGHSQWQDEARKASYLVLKYVDTLGGMPKEQSSNVLNMEMVEQEMEYILFHLSEALTYYPHLHSIVVHYMDALIGNSGKTQAWIMTLWHLISHRMLEIHALYVLYESPTWLLYVLSHKAKHKVSLITTPLLCIDKFKAIRFARKSFLEQYQGFTLQSANQCRQGLVICIMASI